MPGPIPLQDQAGLMGVPDPAMGKPVFNAALPPVQPGDTIDMSVGTPPAFIPQTTALLGQTPKAAPPAATGGDLATEAPFVPPPPQTVTTNDQHVQTQLGLKINPLLQKEMIGSQAREEAASGAATEATAAQQERTAAIESRRVQEEEALRQQQAAAAEARKAKQAEYLANVQKAQDEVDKSHPPEEGFGVKFANAIALALGGLGKALGGQSSVEQVIENARNQRMNVWRAEFSRRQGKVSGAQNIYATFRNQGLDDTAAEAATTQALNKRFESQIKAEMAANSSQITRALGAKSLEQLKQQNIGAQQILDQQAQNRSTIVSDTKTVTGVPKGDEESRGKVMKQADDNKEIAAYRENRNNLRRFNSMVKAGADGAALADFIANTMKQGSYTPSTFNDALKKRGLLDKKLEDLRAAWSGGVPPDLLRDIGTSLAIGARQTQSGAKNAIDYFSQRFEQNGIPRGVLLGGETEDEARERTKQQAASLGLAPK